jgi:pyridoxine 5-phosphate synthase
MNPSPWMLPKLGVNIDHFATLRELRGTPYPDLQDVAARVIRAGAHQITVHLREDRRHIQDADVFALRKQKLPSLNLEMAVSPEIIRIAHKVRPDWVCLVPEKRREVTTEGGLDVIRMKRSLGKVIEGFRKKKIRVSLFIEPDLKVVAASADLGADAVELHTGKYCNATQRRYGARSAAVAASELKRIREAAVLAKKSGVHAHAGHGFDARNVRKVAAFDLIEEYNIGHYIVCRAAVVGIDQAVREMVSAIQAP